MTRRPASSLIEMLIAMSIGSVLAGIAVFMLFSLMRSQGTGKNHLAFQQTVNRLTKQFRDDVHACQKTGTENSGKTLNLLPNTSDGTKICYLIIDSRIDRTETQGDNTLQKESYFLSDEIDPAISLQSQDEQTIASISLTPNPENVPESQSVHYSTPLRIDAILGLDSHLSKVTLPKKAEEAETNNSEQPKPDQEKEKSSDQPKTETPKAEESKSDTAAANQPKPEETKKEQSLSDQSNTEKSNTEKPATEKSTTEQPTTEKPAVEEKP